MDFSLKKKKSANCCFFHPLLLNYYIFNKNYPTKKRKIIWVILSSLCWVDLRHSYSSDGGALRWNKAYHFLEFNDNIRCYKSAIKFYMQNNGCSICLNIRQSYIFNCFNLLPLFFMQALHIWWDAFVRKLQLCEKFNDYTSLHFTVLKHETAHTQCGVVIVTGMSDWSVSNTDTNVTSVWMKNCHYVYRLMKPLMPHISCLKRAKEFGSVET